MADASIILLNLCNAVGLLKHEGDENTAGGSLDIGWFAAINGNINARLFKDPGIGRPFLFSAVCNAIGATAGSPARNVLNADWYEIADNETLYLVVPEARSDTDQSSPNTTPSRYGLGAESGGDTWGTAVLSWLLDLNNVSKFAPSLDAEVWATFPNFMLSKVGVGVLHNQDKDGNVASGDTAILSIKAFRPASDSPDQFMDHTVDLLNSTTKDCQILAALLAKSFIRFESSRSSQWAMLLTNHLLPLLGSQRDGAIASADRKIKELFPWVFDDEESWQTGASPSSSVADWLGQLLPTAQDGSVNAGALAEFIWHLKCLITGDESRNECTGSKIVIAHDAVGGMIGFRAAADSKSLTIGICEPKNNPSYFVNLIRLTLEANSVTAKLIWEGSCPSGTLTFGNGATLGMQDGKLTIALEPQQNGLRIGGTFLRSGGSSLTLTMVLNGLELGCTISPTGLTTTASNLVSVSKLCSWLAALIPTQTDTALSAVATCIQGILSNPSNTSDFARGCFNICPIPLPSSLSFEGAVTLKLGDGSKLSMEQGSGSPRLTLKTPEFSIHGAHGYPLRGITVAVRDTVVMDAGGLALSSKKSHLSMAVTLTDLQLPFGTGSGHNLEQGLLSGIATENPPVTLTLLRDSGGDWFLDKLDDQVIMINRQVGPLYVEQLKVGVEKQSLKVGVDGHFSMAGLEIAPQGLALTAENLLTKAPPDFGASLEGLAISFQGEAMEMSGLFRKYGNDYQGAALIRVAEWQLTAVGAYTMLGDEPSMFVFGGVRTPLGGTPDFFVTGAAGGFGYNRRLKLPGVHQVREHPFLQVMEGELALDDVADGINKYFPAERGAYWFSAGITFISYGFIEGLGLFYARWGEEPGFGLLAMASINMPTPDAPFLVHLGLVINVDVNLGNDPYILASGGLTDDSQLLGGMYSVHGQWALQSWLTNGETVLTAGGYAPGYPKPSKYPDVARLGFEQDLWMFYSSGELYFAVVPDKAMVGGSYRVGVDYGWVGGELSFGIEFVTQWDPFVFILCASVTGSLWVDWELDEFEVGVSVNASIWGPALGGRISIDLEVDTLDLDFGADPPVQNTYITLGEWIDRQLHLPRTDKYGPILVSGAPDPARNQAGAFQLQVLKGRVPSVKGTKGAKEPLKGQDDIRVGTHFILEFKTQVPLARSVGSKTSPPIEWQGNSTSTSGAIEFPESLPAEAQGAVELVQVCEGDLTSELLVTSSFQRDNGTQAGPLKLEYTLGSFPSALYGNDAGTPTARFINGFRLVSSDEVGGKVHVPGPFSLPNHDGMADSDDWGPEPFPGKPDLNLQAILSKPAPTVIPAGLADTIVLSSALTDPDSTRRPSGMPRIQSVAGTSAVGVYIQSRSQVPAGVRLRGRGTQRTSRPPDTQKLFKGAPVVDAPTPATSRAIPGLTLRFVDQAPRLEAPAQKLHRRARPLSAGRSLNAHANRLASSDSTQALQVEAGHAWVIGLNGAVVSETNPVRLKILSGTQALRVLALGRYDRPLLDVPLPAGARTLSLPPRTHRFLLLGLGTPASGPSRTATGFDADSPLMRLGQTGFAGAGCVLRVENGELPERLSDGVFLARRLLAKVRGVRVHFTSPRLQGSLVFAFRARQEVQGSLSDSLRWKASGAALGDARFVLQGERVAVILPLVAASSWWVHLSWSEDFQLAAVVSRVESSAFMAGLLSSDPLWELIDDCLESGSGSTTLKLEAGV